MRASGILLLMAGLGAIATAQQLPQLEGPVGIDVRVRSVNWQPRGLGLLYEKESASGRELGVFRPGKREGRSLLHLGTEDQWEAEWFQHAPILVVNVVRSIQRPEGDLKEASVYVLDAEALKATKVFSRAFDAGVRVDLDVDLSPAAVHGIFRLKIGEERRHLVLPVGRSELIAAPDLDRAAAEGYSGPIWSIDGTAVFRKGGDPDKTVRVALELASQKAAQNASANAALEEKIAIARLSGEPLWVSSPPPPVGAPVMELMPANGALRPVRFRGAWAWPDAKFVPLKRHEVPVPLSLGRSKGQAKSLWLTFAGDKPEAGVLVAAHADRAWIAPQNAAIAYLTDGALFVREIRQR